MGGILGNEAWRRSNGGLWLPRVFGTPETVYGWCCCGEGGEYDAGCECLDAPATLIVDLSEGTWAGLTPCAEMNDAFAHDRVIGDPYRVCDWHGYVRLSDPYSTYVAQINIDGIGGGLFSYFYQVNGPFARSIWYKSANRTLDPNANCFDQFAVDGRIELTKLDESDPNQYCGGTMPDTVYMTRG